VFVGVLVGVTVGAAGVFVAVSVGVGGTEVFVGVLVSVGVGGTTVAVGVLVSVGVGGTTVAVGVLVSVGVGGTGVLVAVAVGVLLGVGVGVFATTVFVAQVLLLSLDSPMLLFGSTEQLPPPRGLLYVSPLTEVTGITTSNLPVVAPSVTVPPLAVQVNVLLVIAQLMFPLLVTLTTFATLGVP
jgi:hypothetical protein